MAISVDEVTKIITVPRADMALIQSMPTEIREHDTAAFRLELRVWEASLPGSWRSITHLHNLAVTVGGVTLIDVIEIINGYTITYEDGQYAVNLIGSNNNFSDVANVNQVSIRSANSAGNTIVETGVSGLTAPESAAVLLSSELQEADHFFDKSTGLLHYYRRGTVIDLIPAKQVAGETAIDDVRIDQP